MSTSLRTRAEFVTQSHSLTTCMSILNLQLIVLVAVVFSGSLFPNMTKRGFTKSLLKHETEKEEVNWGMNCIILVLRYKKVSECCACIHYCMEYLDEKLLLTVLFCSPDLQMILWHGSSNNDNLQRLSTQSPPAPNVLVGVLWRILDRCRLCRGVLCDED